MSKLKRVAAALGVTLAVFVMIAPAEALTARQYQAQGQGKYISSNGSHLSGVRHMRHRRRHMH